MENNARRKDETGNIYGRLTVLAYSHTDRHGYAAWICKCDCGREVIVCGHELRNNETKSCGCLQRETMSAMAGESSPTWRGGKKKNHYGYMLAKADNHPRSDAKGYVLEHIFVAEQALGEYLPEGSIIHHINGIKDDNRLENLWWFLSQSEHMKHHARLKAKQIPSFYLASKGAGVKGEGR